MSWVEKQSMAWIRRIGEYRTLAGKRDLLGALTPAEATRLDTLERALSLGADPERAPFAQRAQRRQPIDLEVGFEGGGGLLTGRARDISGEGLFVETSSPLLPGAQTIVRVVDELAGEAWRFGAEVARVERRGMGLRFLGIPLALRLGRRPPPALPLPHAA